MDVDKPKHKYHISDSLLWGAGDDAMRVRALTSVPMWPGFDSRTRRHMWLSLLLVLFLAPGGSSPGTPVFPSPQKLQFQIPSRSGLLSSTLL